MVRFGTRFAFFLMSFGIPVYSQSDLQVNSFGLLAGRHEVHYEVPLRPALNVRSGLIYEEGRTGILSRMIYPTNLEFDRTLGVSIGLTRYSKSDFRGWFGLLKAGAGWNDVRLSDAPGESGDSLSASGWVLPLEVGLGYKWIWRSRWVFSPEFNIRYLVSTADYSGLRDESVDPLPFVTGRNEIEANHTGFAFSLALRLGYRFLKSR